MRIRKAHGIARKATEKAQARQKYYYDRGIRQRAYFKIGDIICVYRPARGEGFTKF